MCEIYGFNLNSIYSQLILKSGNKHFPQPSAVFHNSLSLISTVAKSTAVSSTTASGWDGRCVDIWFLFKISQDNDKSWIYITNRWHIHKYEQMCHIISEIWRIVDEIFYGTSIFIWKSQKWEFFFNLDSKTWPFCWPDWCSMTRWIDFNMRSVSTSFTLIRCL